MKKKQELLFIIILLLVIAVIAILSSFHDKTFHYLDHLQESFATVDGNDLLLQDLGFYIIYEEALGASMAYEYDANDTSAFWGRHTNGNFISSIARDSAVDMAIHDEIFYQYALSKQMTLTDEEKETVEKRLQDFLGAITVAQLEAVNLNEDSVRNTLLKIALSEKYMIQYAMETGHYYEEFNIGGDAYQKLLQEHEIEKNKYLINKLVMGEISLPSQTTESTETDE